MNPTSNPVPSNPSTAGLRGKVVLITGGTTGIGRAAAIDFARAGALVTVSGRREKEGAETVELVRAAGGEARFLRADVSSAHDVEKLVAATVEAHGRLDVAFNNAGIEGDVMAPLADQDDDDFDRIFAINVKGVYLSMKHQIPALLKSGGGAIVNTTSVAGLIGFPTAGPYAASKHAVIGLTKTAALEYAKHNVRINAVAPGAIETPMLERFTTRVPREMLLSMHPIGRLGTAEEIAAAVVWLSSPQASFVTGHVLTVDGAMTAT